MDTTRQEGIGGAAVVLSVGFAMVLLVVVLVSLFLAPARAGAQVRLATDDDRRLAMLAVSADGAEITVRGRVADSVRLCVEPAAGTFGARRCFTVGAIRRGEVGR